MSCCSNQIAKENSELYISAVPVNFNKIEMLDLGDITDLTNKEINLYSIKKVKLKNIPKIILDIDYSKGISDGMLIEEPIKGNLLIELNSIGKEQTINKKIPFLRVNENSDLKVNVNFPESIDNTIFEVVKEKKGEYIYFLLKPLFLDENTWERKVKEDIEKETNIAFYEDNLIAQYHLKERIGGKIYNRNLSKLKKATYLEGNSIENAEINIRKENGTIIKTKADEHGKWRTFVELEDNKIFMSQKYKLKNKFVRTLEVEQKLRGENND